MKSLLIRLLILPEGLISLVSFCLLALILLHLPQNNFSEKTSSDEDTFPGHRRGGGTHLIQPHSEFA